MVRRSVPASSKCVAKQISVPIETGEENVSEKRVREAQFWALGFSSNRRKGYAVKNLAGGLKTETVRYKLSVAREFKMEIPVKVDKPERATLPAILIYVGTALLGLGMAAWAMGLWRADLAIPLHRPGYDGFFYDMVVK